MADDCKHPGVIADVESDDDYSLDRAYEVEGTPGSGQVDVAEHPVLPSLVAGIGLGLAVYLGYRFIKG